MWINYANRIQESVGSGATPPPIKMLRLLKADTYRSRRALAPLLGYTNSLHECRDVVRGSPALAMVRGRHPDIIILN